MTSSAAGGPDSGPDAREFRILVVCTANICRSPMAEYLLRGLLEPDEASTQWRYVAVSSAGVLGWDGAEMDPPAAAELRRLGGDPTGFRAQSFAPELGEGADLILTATVEHRRFVLEEVPRALHRTFTLLEFAHLVSTVEQVRAASGDPARTVRLAAAHRGSSWVEGYDLADPYGRPAAVHRRIAEVVLAAARTVAGALAPATPPE
jgi:protein-tyrosine phosphatase